MDYNCQAEEELFQRWRSAEKGWVTTVKPKKNCFNDGGVIKEQDVY